MPEGLRAGGPSADRFFWLFRRNRNIFFIYVKTYNFSMLVTHSIFLKNTVWAPQNTSALWITTGHQFASLAYGQPCKSHSIICFPSYHLHLRIWFYKYSAGHHGDACASFVHKQILEFQKSCHRQHFRKTELLFIFNWLPHFILKPRIQTVHKYIRLS